VTDAGFDSGPDAQFVDQQRLIRRPDNTLAVRLSAVLDPRVSVGGVLTVIGSRDDLQFAQFPNPTQRVTLPSYATVDLSGRLTLLEPHGLTPGLALQARVENLFDEDYQQVAGFLSPGRTVIVGVSAGIH